MLLHLLKKDCRLRGSPLESVMSATTEREELAESYFIGKKEEIIKTKRITKFVHGREILVIHHKGTFYAMDLHCYREYNITFLKSKSSNYEFLNNVYKQFKFIIIICEQVVYFFSSDTNSLSANWIFFLLCLSLHQTKHWLPNNFNCAFHKRRYATL